MTNHEKQTSSFPKLDRVIRSQRRMMVLEKFVTLAFVIGAVGAVSSVTACGAASDPYGDETAAEMRNRETVESANEGTPLPAFRSEILAAMPDATFELVDVLARGDQVVAKYDVRGALRAELAGLRPTGDRVELRIEVVTAHDRDGRILSARRRLERADRVRLE